MLVSTAVIAYGTDMSFIDEIMNCRTGHITHCIRKSMENACSAADMWVMILSHGHHIVDLILDLQYESIYRKVIQIKLSFQSMATNKIAKEFNSYKFSQ